MTAKKHSPARRALQVLIVFILSALISRTSFASTLDVANNSEVRAQQYSCYSNM